jgi:putative addiction module killer protein
VIKVQYYKTESGKSPFLEWLEGLKDARSRAVIKVRIDRLLRGLFGDAKSIGGGVNELRIHIGPGYRVYFGRDGKQIVLLLCGGSKRTQKSDISKAKKYWADYLEVNYGKDKKKKR